MNKFFLVFLMLGVGLMQVNAQSKIPTAPNATDAQGRKQGKWVITLDKNWKPTTTDIAYYRVVEYQNGKVIGKVKDFYAHNHKLQFEGEMLDDTPQNEKLKGRCVWYYDTGIKAQEMRFDDNGNLLERKYFDEKGNLIPEEQANAQVRALEDFVKGYQLKQEGKYQEALPYLENAKKVLNQQNCAEYHLLLGGLVLATQNLKMWGKAAQYADEYLPALKDKFGENAPKYIEALLDVAFIYEMANEFQKAEQCYQEVLRYVEKTMGKKSKAYVAQISNIASTYFLRDDFKTTLKYLLDIKETALQVYGKNDPNYAFILENIGSAYTRLNDCTSAKPYLQESLQIFKDKKGTSSQEYQRVQKVLDRCR